MQGFCLAAMFLGAENKINSYEKIITEDDLKKFSDELQDAVKQLQERMEE